MPDTTYDALSLTLPTRARTRVRFRRPKRPSFWACYLAFLTVVNFLGAIADFAIGHFLPGLFYAISATGWSIYARCLYRTGADFPRWRPFWPYGFCNMLGFYAIASVLGLVPWPN